MSARKEFAAAAASNALLWAAIVGAHFRIPTALAGCYFRGRRRHHHSDNPTIADCLFRDRRRHHDSSSAATVATPRATAACTTAALAAAQQPSQCATVATTRAAAACTAAALSAA